MNAYRVMDLGLGYANQTSISLIAEKEFSQFPSRQSKQIRVIKPPPVTNMGPV